MNEVEINKNTLHSLKAILELIEDERHPAKRVIYDYVTGLLPYDLQEEANELGKNFFKLRDAKPNNPPSV